MKVLLAVDGSPYSDVAIDEVANLPLPTGSVVQVVTVDAPIESPLVKGSPTIFDELVKQQREETCKQLDAAAHRLRTLAPHLTVQARLLDGHPKDTIVNEAERWGADLIVVGSQGHGPLRRFFLGSVSEFVAQRAPCSVLIARSRPTTPREPEATA